MKKQMTKKLSFSRETLRNLSNHELQQAFAGGERTGPASVCTDTCTCCITENCTGTAYCTAGGC